jgi:hypothetical protein
VRKQIHWKRNKKNPGNFIRMKIGRANEFPVFLPLFHHYCCRVKKKPPWESLIINDL